MAKLLDVLVDEIKQLAQAITFHDKEEIDFIQQSITHLLNGWFERNGRDILCCLTWSPREKKERKGSKLCQVTESVVPLTEKGKTATPFMVTLKNKENNQFFVLKVIPELDLPLEYDVKGVTYGATKIDGTCVTYNPFHGMVYFGCKSDFLNEALIAMIIRRIWPVEIPRLFVIHHLAGTCLPAGTDTMATGLHFMKFSDRKTLEQFANVFPRYVENVSVSGFTFQRIKPSIVMQILQQCVMAFDILSRSIAFSHGDAKPANVFVSQSKVDVRYRGMRVQSDFQCQVADFGNSSATFEGIRFYPFSPYAEWLPYASPTTTDSRYVLTDSIKAPQGLLSGQRILARSRYSRFPFYKSFDMYCFICSLFTLSEFYQALLTSSMLQKVWNLLWDSKTTSFLMIQKLSGLSQDPKHHPLASVVALFSPRRLKCNLLDELIHYFGRFEKKQKKAPGEVAPRRNHRGVKTLTEKKHVLISEQL